jgi:ribosome-associated toxin RatA of RatAB toxin-antitoxin module
LGDGQQRACRVELRLNYGFANAALAALVGPVFDRIAASLVDAFVKRAEQVYG